MAYWWCTDHNTVEGDSGCRAEVRLGPYPTEEAASHALSNVAERNKEQDAKDEAWEERGERT
ncbi:MAG: hypothetical protein JWN35_704 [Frankiales bacterium]|jgi:hypothetical protein|nr:hypothetical protein [Frankiales bacterium]